MTLSPAEIERIRRDLENFKQRKYVVHYFPSRGRGPDPVQQEALQKYRQEIDAWEPSQDPDLPMNHEQRDAEVQRRGRARDFMRNALDARPVGPPWNYQNKVVDVYVATDADGHVVGASSCSYYSPYGRQPLDEQIRTETELDWTGTRYTGHGIGTRLNTERARDAATRGHKMHAHADHEARIFHSRLGPDEESIHPVGSAEYQWTQETTQKIGNTCLPYSREVHGPDGLVHAPDRPGWSF